MEKLIYQIIRYRPVHDVNIHHTWSDPNAILIEISNPIKYNIYKENFDRTDVIIKPCSTSSLLCSMVYEPKKEYFQICIFPVDQYGFKFRTGISETLKEDTSKRKFNRIKYVEKFIKEYAS